MGEQEKEPQSVEQEVSSQEPEHTEKQPNPVEDAPPSEEHPLPVGQSNVNVTTPEKPTQELSQVNPEPEPIKEPEPAAPSGLSLKITPPKVNPAGPPPVADDTEKFTNDNVVKSDNTVSEDMDTDEVSSEPKDRSKKKNKKKKKKNRPEIWAKQAQEAERKKKEEAERAANEL